MEGCVKMEEEMGVMQPQAKEPWGLLAAASSWERDGADSPSEPPEGTNPAHTFISDLWPPGLWDKTFVLCKATQFVVIC